MFNDHCWQLELVLHLSSFRNGDVMEYHGDRTKEALIDFAKKAYG